MIGARASPGVTTVTTTDFSQHSADEGDRSLLHRAFEDVLSYWGSMAPMSSGTQIENDLEASQDVDLLDFMRGLSQAQRQLNAVLAATANEIEKRSDGMSRGGESLALRHGYRNGRDFIAEVMRIEPRDAASIARVGEAVIGERGLTGRRVPPKNEHVAGALRSGEIGLVHANEIVKFTQRLRLRVAPNLLAQGERDLVVTAKEGMRIRDFREVCARLEAHLDPDGVEPTIEEQRRHRCLSMRTDSDTGMMYLRGKFDAESAAYVVHALQSYTTGCMRASRGSNFSGDAEVPTAGEAPPSNGAHEAVPGVHFVPTDSRKRGYGNELAIDSRSIPQIQADGLVDFCKHILGCDLSKLPGVSTSVVVRMNLGDVVPDGEAGESSKQSGQDSTSHSTSHCGLATIDGGTVIDVETARKLAASANLIPAVLSTDGAMLDLGREARHFTKWQRLALIERDGGCAFCGLPPGMTEAHHINWWRAHDGTTDLDNGVLLCTSCHHRVHKGWEIRIEHNPDAPPNQRKRGGTVWFIPPADIDWRREPRLGGRKRFDIAYRRENPPVPLREYSGASWTEGWRGLDEDSADAA